MEGNPNEGNCRQSWDACREVPVIEDEEKPKKRTQFLKWLCCFIVGVLVFAFALISKSSFLILVTLVNEATRSINAEHKVSALLGIGCVLVGPNVLLLIKSLWKFIFKSAVKPSRKTVLWVTTVEIIVGVGEVFLTVVAMPHFDIITNVMILNGVSILSAVFQVTILAKERRNFKYVPVSSILLILLGFVFFIISYVVMENSPSKLKVAVGLAIAGTICVSLNWWENYTTLFQIPFLKEISKDVAKSRNVVCILSSLVKMIITAIGIGVYGQQFTSQGWKTLTSISEPVRNTVFGLAALQIFSSAMCRWFVVVACKMHALRRCFLVPMYLASVAVIVIFLLPFALAREQPDVLSMYCKTNAQTSIPSTTPGSNAVWYKSIMADITGTLCMRQIVKELNIPGLVILGLCVLSWWVGFILSTVYIWYLKIQRIERTQDLFVKQMFEGAFLEQSMLLNTRFEVKGKAKDRSMNETAKVYLCATMWHETYDEMMKIIISMFRLDKYRPKINSFNDAIFEFHIYFDDAFKDVFNGKTRHLNDYAKDLVDVLSEVYVLFSDDDSCIFKKRGQLPSQKMIRTPYGGRLEYTLPKGNLMMVHFKDKQKIRHKKRWSQIMYLYYLLGWKLNRKYFKMFEEGGNEKILREKIETEKKNTYILALDGDTDFQPSAVMLLIDRLKLYPEVGAACGRIHPTGTGPMVWYQKFEYAVGHWLQKTAEHVFGCVLCSPGCFSLFRAAALMDDNVMKRYTSKPVEASQHIQYDQGEDRWLCTLLLQQGWRVEYNAASDAYTNAPQDFKEFYNQRRRWGPSTMANTIDLLGTGQQTSKRNSSISKPYIIYQVISMGASVLGPATICLMIAGSFTFIFKMNPNTALILATVPPTIYLILCFKLKSDTQIQIAAIMSVLYAFLMTGTILSIIGDIVREGTFMTPSGLFIIAMTLMYVITAALHPQEFPLVIYGILYFLCIPSGYLMLVIYSIVNMNNVTWGTRETGVKAKTAAVGAIKKHFMQAMCCKCPRENNKDNTNENEPLLEAVSTEEPELQMSIQTEETERPQETFTPQDPTSWRDDLKKQSRDFPLHKDELLEDETKFWKDLLVKYLEPLQENKEQQEKIAKELKELRNKVAFGFFICNALWIVATLFLQTIGNVITLNIPKIYPNGTFAKEKSYSVDPISLMFLLSFALLLIMQFFAMLYHRTYTLIHFVAYTDTEAKAVRKRSYEKKQVPKDSDTISMNNIYETNVVIPNPLANDYTFT